MRWITGLILCAALASVSSKASTPTSSQNLGSVAVGSSSAPLTFQVSGLSSTPSFAPHYGTEFSLVQTSCSSTPVTCNVTVKFTPLSPGLRQDAIDLIGPNGTLLAVALLYGVGQGPEALLRPGILNDFAGTGYFGDTGDGGPATSAMLANPQGVAVDNAGNVYISDSVNNVVRKVDTTGTITTVAGGGSGASLGDGGLATNAVLNVPSGLALDGAGNLYIADAQNNVVRRVDAVTQIITTVAGNGNTSGTSLGDSGAATAAILYNPIDVAVDGTGNLFIADQYDNRIRRVDAVTGVITTVAGGGTNLGNDGLGDGGAATGATLGAPSSVAVDAAGNLYIADTWFDVIREVSGGTITVVAGTLGAGSFNEPGCVRVDAGGDIYVADTNDSLLWEVDASGLMFTLAGQSGQFGYNGDGVLASQAELWGPSGIALDAAGNIYVADQGNLLVRKLVPGPSALSFGTAAVGSTSTPQTVSVDNIGNQPLSFTAFGVSGNFVQQSGAGTYCGTTATVPAASSCLAAVAFAPQTSGLLNGVLSWQTNGQTAATTLALSGMGGANTSPALNISSMIFPSQSIGSSSAAQTVTLTNYGTAAVNNPGASISGTNSSDFSTTNNCGSTLAANASCTISVTFTPVASGTRNATMTVLETDSSNNQISQSVSLQGVGTAAPALTTSAAVQFGSQVLGVTSAVQTVTLTNSSSANLWIASVALAGGPGDFAIAGTTCGSTLSANSSCSVSVTFTPSTLGQEQTALQFTDEGGNSPQSVTLQGTGVRRVNNDYDGDGKSDMAVWRPSNGIWYIVPSSNPSNQITKQWGYLGDIPVPGDYDGDGKIDMAVWRPSNGIWYIVPSSNPSQPITKQWGLIGDVPVPGDYDGDGKIDMAVWRPSNGIWYIIPSSNPSQPITKQWGYNGDIPVPGDYDGDGKTDMAVWRPSNGIWYIVPSSNPSNQITKQWGYNGDIPVPGDYDGDGKIDMAVWRPSNGIWYIVPSGNPSNQITKQWGYIGDVPVPGDYDGDGKTDMAVWRPSNGIWYIVPSSNSSNQITQLWGYIGDIPK